MFANKQTTPPAVEPVTGTLLDTHLRGDGELVGAEAAFLDTLIIASREYIEAETRRSMITQTWTAYLDRWPNVEGQDDWWDGVREGAIGSMGSTSDFIELPIAPLQSVTSIKTFSSDNTETTYDSSNYFLDTTSVLGRIIRNSGSLWPTALRTRNAIEIVYVTGYGASATAVPGALKQAVLQLAGHWYENREFVKEQSDMNQAATPMHVQRIINQWKVMKL